MGQLQNFKRKGPPFLKANHADCKSRKGHFQLIRSPFLFVWPILHFSLHGTEKKAFGYTVYHITRYQKGVFFWLGYNSSFRLVSFLRFFKALGNFLVNCKKIKVQRIDLLISICWEKYQKVIIRNWANYCAQLFLTFLFPIEALNHSTIFTTKPFKLFLEYRRFITKQNFLAAIAKPTKRFLHFFFLVPDPVLGASFHHLSAGLDSIEFSPTHFFTILADSDRLGLFNSTFIFIQKFCSLDAIEKRYLIATQKDVITFCNW